MTKNESHLPVAVVLASAIALTGLVACGGDSQNAPPQTPADQTTTTGASAPGQTYASTPAPTPAVTPNPASNDVGTPQATMPPMGEQPSGSSTTTTTGPTMGSSDSVLSDPQIIAIVEAADRGEIEQGREANRKSKNIRVKSFGERMVKDHSAAETTLASLSTKASIAPQTNSTAQQIGSNGAQIMVGLRASSGEGFDKAYMDAQVEEHTQVLRLLDDQLIPHAQNADLRKTLQDVRSKVADHSKMAQDIQSSLSSSKK